jgi:hypothetical protein
VALGLASFLKHNPWYAFGSSNAEIADRVAFVCQILSTYCDIRRTVETDFETFDATVSGALRGIERILVLHMFAEDDRDFVSATLSLVYDTTTVSKVGDLRYKAGKSQLSGDPFTSVLNTLRNAFVAYYALRTDPNLKCDAETAWNLLGLYGGDDGITPCVDPDHYSSVAGKLGLRLKAAERIPGQTVSFLARFWGPGVWHGDNNSMCDAVRMLSKFHLTTQSVIVPNVAICREKAWAYLLNDSDTPYIGPLLRILADGFDPSDDDKARLAGNDFNLSRTLDARYPNTRAVWMNTVMEAEGSVDWGAMQRWCDAQTWKSPSWAPFDWGRVPTFRSGATAPIDHPMMTIPGFNAKEVDLELGKTDPDARVVVGEAECGPLPTKDAEAAGVAGTVTDPNTGEAEAASAIPAGVGASEPAGPEPGPDGTPGKAESAGKTLAKASDKLSSGTARRGRRATGHRASRYKQ